VAAVANWRRASACGGRGTRASRDRRARAGRYCGAEFLTSSRRRKHKLETARRGADEGDQFFKLTQSLENGGEVAHSDVIKAELQMRDRQRQLQEAQLAC